MHTAQVLVQLSSKVVWTVEEFVVYKTDRLTNLSIMCGFARSILNCDNLLFAYETEVFIFKSQIKSSKLSIIQF